MITIYVGDSTEYLSHLAKTNDSNAKLVTTDNFENLVDGTYFSSVGDIGNLFNFGKLLQQADKIVYAPPPNGHWTGGENMKNWTEEYIENFSFKCYIENYKPPAFEFPGMLQLADGRKTENPQLWTAGCSISHGVGVTDSQRFGTLLSNQLNLSVSFLTCRSSSIMWAADQILRSDIREGDIVVWGLTSHRRFPYFNNNSIKHVKVSPYSTIEELDELDSENLLYRNLTSVFQVSNFCKKIKCKLILASLIDNKILSCIRDFPNLVVLSKLWGRGPKDLFIDQGTDNSHPGLKTHQYYADEIYKKISNQLLND